MLKLLQSLSAPITQWLSNSKELKMAKHSRDLAIINNQARLAADKETNNAAWEMASLKETGRLLRVLCFLIFTTPIIVTVVSPETGAEIWVNLDLVPEWFMQLFFYMFAGIWGVAELKENVPSIVGALASRRLRKEKTNERNS